jgi:hypothetical protein
VVRQQLGVDPDLGRGRLAVVPALPPGQDRIAGRDIRLGAGSVDVTASRSGRTMRVAAHARLHAALTLGVVLPAGAAVAAVRLDGHAAAYRIVPTARGAEVRVRAGAGGRHALEVRLR